MTRAELEFWRSAAIVGQHHAARTSSLGLSQGWREGVGVQICLPSSVTVGDTSELNIDFSIIGGGRLVFGGTNAPDIFSLITAGHITDWPIISILREYGDTLLKDLRRKHSWGGTE